MISMAFFNPNLYGGGGGGGEGKFALPGSFLLQPR